MTIILLQVIVKTLIVKKIKYFKRFNYVLIFNKPRNFQLSIEFLHFDFFVP